MTKSKHSVKRSLFATVTALALFATACGGGGAAPTSEQASAAKAAAEVNIGALDLNDDLATTELLNAADGSITTLSDVVTGDRPVLVWYWAPH